MYCKNVLDVESHAQYNQFRDHMEDDFSCCSDILMLRLSSLQKLHSYEYHIRQRQWNRCESQMWFWMCGSFFFGHWIIICVLLNTCNRCHSCVHIVVVNDKAGMHAVRLTVSFVLAQHYMAFPLSHELSVLRVQRWHHYALTTILRNAFNKIFMLIDNEISYK